MSIVYQVKTSCFLSTHQTIPLGIAYAIWSGIGIILTACIGFFVFRQSLDLPAVIGIVMIMGGVTVMNVFSKSVGH
ncbi:hypothetical protein HLH12_09605 [Acinetobacter sp. NIPH 2377]|uniref:DMT family transporter n=1 Tax=Acinetobacter terrestris TaxID=2529843 RepID=UPI00148F9B38|nr:SMR family transporter [Acinetobacter terrestris]NNH35800.1 hypothetical protein [Acinetobacter terrestris]